MARRRTRRRRAGSICVATANKAHEEALKKCGKALEMAKKSSEMAKKSSGVAARYLSAAKAKSPTKSYTPGKIGSVKGRWPSAKLGGRRRRRRTKRRRRSRSRSRGRKSRRRRRRRSRRR